MGIRHRCLKCGSICNKMRFFCGTTNERYSFWRCRDCASEERILPRVRKPKQFVVTLPPCPYEPGPQQDAWRVCILSVSAAILAAGGKAQYTMNISGDTK